MDILKSERLGIRIIRTVDMVSGSAPPKARRGGRASGRRVWYGIAVVLALAWLVGAGPLGMYIGRLGEVQSDDQGAFLPVDSESTAVSDVQDAFSADEPVPAIVVYSADAPLGQDDLDAITDDARDLADAEGVEGDPIGPLPGSEDDRVAQLIVPLASDAEPDTAVADLRDRLADRPDDGLTAQVTGPAGFAADTAAAFGGIDGTLLAIALGAVLVILIAVYRSPLLPIAVILSAVLALALAGALVYAAAANGWILLNGQSQGILFILVVGACTDYALLLVSRYRETLMEHERTFDALRHAVRGTVEPITASGGTVILGVLCLLASDLASNRDLGPVAAIGVGAAVVAALTFLPAVLLLLGRWAFWPLVPRHTDGAADESTDAVLRRHPLWGRVAAGVAARPRALWITCAAVLLAAAAFVPQFRAEGTAQVDIFRTEVEAVEGQAALERGFGSEAAAQPAVIVADAGRVAEVVEAAEDVDGVASVAPVTEEGAGPAAAGGPPASQAPPREVDGRVLIEAVLDAPAESPEARDIVRDLRAAVHDVPGAGGMVGGPSAVSLDTLETSQRDLAVVIPLVLLVVFAVLVLLLRAVVAPLLLIATTVLSFGSALGVGALVFNDLLGFPGADPVVPLFAFVFLVALGIDYNIFLMTRARTEALRHGHRDGTLRALAVTGGVITSAGVVLAATFAALAVIPILFLVQLAFLVAFGVLLDALLVRSVLVPALTLDVGRATWWPARLGRRGRAGADAGADADRT
jgi:RND superfamily putative drug exporter